MRGTRLTRRRLLATSAAVATTAVFAGSPFGTPVGAASLPSDVVLPPTCRLIPDGPLGDWRVDCGPQDNRQIRAALGPLFAAQSWSLAHIGLARAEWVKGNLHMFVTESSGLPSDYPRLLQRPISIGGKS